jgi:hypothetical protein
MTSPSRTSMGGSPAPNGDSYWVTWRDESDGTAARASALIWGPQPNPPPQLAGFFESTAFATRAEAVAYRNSIGKGTIGGLKIGNPLSGVNAIGDFFNRLSEKATWIRVGEVIVGGVILFIGIHALASGTAVSNASKAVAKPAKKASKAALSLGRL